MLGFPGEAITAALFADASLSYSFGVVLARGVLKPLRMIRKNKLTF